MVVVDVKSKYATLSKHCANPKEAFQYIKYLKDNGIEVVSYGITKVAQ